MKAVLFGTGWRARFFLRIAKALPSILEITAVYTHSKERAKEIEMEGFFSSCDINTALSMEHDAVIVASGKNDYFHTVQSLNERGECIISETSLLSLSDEELEELCTYKGMVMEQYQYTPQFASLLNSLPFIDGIDQLYLSGLHNHHSASIARKVLSLGCRMPDEACSMDFPSKMMKTGGRGCMVSGGIGEYERKVRLLRFGTSLFIHDFSSNQYHSYLYGKSFEVRGTSGIITERGLSTVDDSGYPVFIPFVFHRDSSTGNGSLALSHVTLGDKTVFINPYYPENLNDDEIAMAWMLDRFGKGDVLYPFREGVADARLGKLL